MTRSLARANEARQCVIEQFLLVEFHAGVELVERGDLGFDLFWLHGGQRCHLRWG